MSTVNNYITNWQAFTPTSTWSTNATHTGQYTQIADTLFCIVKVACTGAVTAAALVLNLPSGFTIDTTKLVATVNGEVGVATISDTGTLVYDACVTYATSTTVNVVYATSNIVTGVISRVAVTQAAPFTFGNTAPDS